MFNSSKFIQESKSFNQTFPTDANRIESIIARSPDPTATAQKIESFAERTRIIVPAGVEGLIDDFLAVKKSSGTLKEQSLYAEMTTKQFIRRLIEKRPLSFFGSCDENGTPFDITVLRDGSQIYGGVDSDPWELVGADEEGPIEIEHYLTYDEMQISALIGVSVPTLFINNGARNNAGQVAEPNTYIPEGVLVGLVGARFENPKRMESEHIIVHPDHNTEYYYGPNPTDDLKTKLLQVWAKFYQVDYFLTFREILDQWNFNEEIQNRYHYSEQNCCFVDKILYKKRIGLTIGIFLADANARGSEQNQKVWCHVVGLGLGVWQCDPIQQQWYLEVFAETLRNGSYEFISNVDFSWFQASLDVAAIGDIQISFSRRNPADISDETEGKLLVAMYAWDSNAYPGNEYWIGSLDASGDPAAACCSLIPELQNPQINPDFLDRVTWY